MIKYSPSTIEKKWQRYWASKKFYFTKDKGQGENFMLLTEFPYPSGNLHIGHWYAFSVPDILARYLRMKGHNVLYPIGFDAFGLPAENAAIKNQVNPRDWTQSNISYMTKQLSSMGATFDWSRAVSSIDPEYYRWTQWLFIKFYEKGLAYRAKTSVNWCPKDKTVLANEQVVNGCCERCDTPVIQKELVQWMLKIIEYADRLIDEMVDLNWPETIKTAQRNWIGRSNGAEINFLLPNSKETIKVFTTRADTLYGVTYVVLAPEHPLITKLTTNEYLDRVNKYLEEVSKKSEHERINAEKEKTGVPLGTYAINPVNQEKIPIWVADYVVARYGTGAVMAVPAHDERDSKFAQKYNLPVSEVISPIEEVLINSDNFSGLSTDEARERIVESLANRKLASKKTNYKLHDWVLSRQRYWGTPIPMVHCQKCGYQPVPEKDLPVELPKLDDYLPTADGRSPLAKAKNWLITKCSRCNGPAERETDTMDTFIDSSWYFLRYVDPKNKKVFADKKKMAKWLPVHLYIGGAEHNTMHLLYSRFFTKALYDLDLIEFNEPFLSRRNHGLILGPNRQRMSKSRGNVIDPDNLVKIYGSDTVRMYLAFLGPYVDQDYPWDPKGINGVNRFLNRIWNFAINGNMVSKTNNQDVEKILNQAIKKVGDDIKDLKFNTATSQLMMVLNLFEKTAVSRASFKDFLKILSPFAPHLTEEIWQTILKHKKSIHLEKWPTYNESIIVEQSVKIPIQINGKVRDIIIINADALEEEVKNMALENPKIQTQLNGQIPKKFVYIPGKVLNIVI